MRQTIFCITKAVVFLCVIVGCLFILKPVFAMSYLAFGKFMIQTLAALTLFSTSIAGVKEIKKMITKNNN